MHLISRIFLVGYLLIVALFFTCGIGLIVLSALEAWNALNPGIDAPVRARFDRRASALHALRPVVLQAEAVRVLADLEKDGIAATSLESLFGSSVSVQELLSYARELNGQGAAGRKKSFIKLADIVLIILEYMYFCVSH
jgi:hypothetical protein